MNCKNCGCTFDPDSPFHKKHGLYTECNKCGLKTDKLRAIKRSIGIQGGEGINKTANISIIRNPQKHHMALLRSQQSGTFNACLPLGSYSSSFAEKKEAGESLSKRPEQTKGPNSYETRKGNKK